MLRNGRRAPARIAALTLSLGLSLGVSVGLSACGGSSQPSVSTSAGAVASQAPATGAALDPVKFAAALKRPATVILDVRTPAEYAAGHLPGAVNLDVESSDFLTGLDQLDPGVPFAVYCRSGNRSGVALTAMTARGFDKAYHLAGGITAWQDAGGDVTTD